MYRIGVWSCQQAKTGLVAKGSCDHPSDMFDVRQQTAQETVVKILIRQTKARFCDGDGFLPHKGC